MINEHISYVFGTLSDHDFGVCQLSVVYHVCEPRPKPKAWAGLVLEWYSKTKKGHKERRTSGHPLKHRKVRPAEMRPETQIDPKGWLGTGVCGFYIIN